MPLRQVRLLEMLPYDDDYQRQLDYEQEREHWESERQLQWEDARQRQLDATVPTHSPRTANGNGDDARDGNWRWARRM